VNTSRGGWRLIAGVVVMLFALVVVGRLQGRNLGGDEAGPAGTTRTTAGSAHGTAASGLAVAGRVALPGQPLAVTVGEGAVWVLLPDALLRVDADRYRVTGSVELGPPAGDMTVGPLAVGAGAVWVGTGDGARVTARVDPVSLRVTARFGGHVAVVARGMLWSPCCPRGDKAMGAGRVDARTLRPHPPLVLRDASGRRHPVGRFAVGGGAVWTQVPGDERVWRVPLAGGRARAIGVSGFGYGLAADERAAWVLLGTSDPGIEPDRTGRLRRLDQRTGEVTVTTPLPDLAANLAVGPVLGDGAVWLAGPYTQLQRGGGILLRVDPASGRVAGWFWSLLGFRQDVLAAGPRGAWVATAVPELLHVVPA
jgi:outer membrane protein assembly factor BamB